MAVHKLILDDVFDDASCTLIAIHCAIEDYRLAYLLNKHLGISLTRKREDLNLDDGLARYPIFEYEDKKQLLTWSLVANICKTETRSKIDFQSLFKTQQNVVNIHSLIPEYPKVNYFLKIDTKFKTNKEKYIMNNLQKIPQIAMTYSVDISQLKSRAYLIFS